jgi:hypothetical protein
MLDPGLEGELSGWITGVAERGFLVQGERDPANHETAQSFESADSAEMEVRLDPHVSGWQPFRAALDELRRMQAEEDNAPPP